MSTGGSAGHDQSGTKRKRNQDMAGGNESSQQTRSNEIRTGNFGSILKEYWEQGRLSELTGNIPTEATQPEVYLRLQKVASFLTQHRLAEEAARTTPTASVANGETSTAVAASTVADASGSAPSTSHNAHDVGAISTAPYYLPTMKKFAQSQRDRQAAGLRTNTNKESASGQAQVIDAHTDALEKILSMASVLLSSDVACRIHRLLCPTHPQAGVFRNNNVRTGRTRFGNPQSAREEIELVWNYLSELKSNWSLSSDNMTVNNLYNTLSFAALAMYAMNDIHPFADGNGRMSRLYVNGILYECLRLPFTITLVATPQQRQEYIQGIRLGQVKLMEKHKDGASHANSISLLEDDDIEHGMLEPLIHLLLDRLVHAVVQIQSLLTEEARIAFDKQESQMARNVRERAAQGQCLICLDSNPNIATLCCGQAVHLNCMAEWLATGSTCVSCRKPLPRLNVGRQPEAQPQQQPNRDLRAELEVMQNIVQRAMEGYVNPPPPENPDSDTTTTTTTDTDEEVTNDPPAPAPRPQCAAGNCSNIAAQDCPNSMCLECCFQFGHGSCARHGRDQTSEVEDTEDTTTTTTDTDDDDGNADTTTTTDNEVDNEDTTTTTDADHVCNNCQNVAARDCANGMCGRCCNSNGMDTCQRHNPPPPDNDTTSTTSDVQDNVTTSDSDNTSTTTGNVATSQGYTMCSSCGRNRAAQDCANDMCGRCCVISGLSYCCERHG